MSSFSDGLSDRLLVFAVNIVLMEKYLCKSYAARHIYSQLFRAGTSAGANYEEAKAGESRPDFIHKMQIVLKELRESRFWIKLILKGKLLSNGEEAIELLFNESKELANIIAKSIVTAKSNIVKNTTRV